MNSKRLMMGSAVALVLAVFCAPPATAASAGDRDTSFSSDGKTFTDVFGANDTVEAVVVQTDGKIVAVGTWSGGAVRSNFAMIRYNPNGSVDTSFGSGGRTLTDFDGDDDSAFDAKLQPDGKVVVAGRTKLGGRPSDFALARYDTNGKLDTTFAGNGKLATDFGGHDGAMSLVIQPDGKIVAAGYRSRPGFADTGDMVFARYLSNGKLDPAFGGGTGKAIVSLGSDGEAAYDVALQPDGKIVAAGYKDDGEGDCFACRDADYAVVRLRTDGTPDTSFDGDGKVSEGLGAADSAHAVAIQSDGKILAVGTGRADWDDDVPYVIGVIRFHTNGKIDTSYGYEGKSMNRGSAIGRNTTGYDAVLQSDGKLVVVGSVGDGKGGTDFVVKRLTTSGGGDVSFGDRSSARTSFHTYDRANAVALQPDGRIIAAGTTSASDGADFAIARYYGRAT